ncbi:MAG: hypothetical protein OHK0031_02530 [Anaerolineales bacterium]
MEKIPAAIWTVAQTLKVYPPLAGVLLSLKTDCVGCHLNRFCTLKEVAASYEIPLETLLEKSRKNL